MNKQQVFRKLVLEEKARVEKVILEMYVDPQGKLQDDEKGPSSRGDENVITWLMKHGFSTKIKDMTNAIEIYENNKMSGEPGILRAMRASYGDKADLYIATKKYDKEHSS